MLSTIEWIRTELLMWIEVPSAVLYPTLGALVVAALWLQTKTHSVHKVREGVVVQSWLDAFNARLVLVISVAFLVITPLWGLVSRPIVTVVCLAGLGLLVKRVFYGRPLGGLDMNETRLFIGLPALVVVDVLIGVSAPLAKFATLVTITSALTIGLLVEREIDNDKGLGDQVDGGTRDDCESVSVGPARRFIRRLRNGSAVRDGRYLLVGLPCLGNRRGPRRASCRSLGHVVF